MRLNHTEISSHIEIKSPRWKQRVIGIATFRVGEHNAIDILATDKDGKRLYPEPLYGSGDMIRACEKQTLNPSGVTLYLVPISKLEPLEEVVDV